MQTIDLQTEIKKNLLQLGNTLIDATESEPQTLAILQFVNGFISQKEKQEKIKNLIDFLQKNPKAGKTEIMLNVAKIAM